MPDRKILAFYAPYSQAGKSTAAQEITYMERAKGFYPLTLSFADPLYRYAEYLQPELSRKEDKNKTFEEFGGKTLREFLIYFGQAGREFYADIWSEKLRRKIKYFRNSFNIVIDDLRFCNEYAMLREEGAKIVRIANPGREIIKTETEALLEDYEFDYQLMNYKRGIKEYQAQIEEMMSKIWQQA